MRKPYIAGNWKMNLDRKSAIELAQALRDRSRSGSCDIAVFPSFVYVEEIVRTLAGSGIRVGAQNCCDEAEGAFTGEVSAAMVKDIGAQTVILGHSERRHLYGEGDELVGAKVAHALKCGLEVILCVGETLEERDGNTTEQVCSRQTTAGLAHVDAADMDRITLAYEPVWAIGTG
ncbi:MAG: triose-phosphate isomerase, partial [Pseudomonadota bacterium]